MDPKNKYTQGHVTASDVADLVLARDKMRDAIAKAEDERKTPRVLKRIECCSAKHHARAGVVSHVHAHGPDRRPLVNADGSPQMRPRHWSNDHGTYDGEHAPAHKCELCHHLDEEEAAKAREAEKFEINDILDKYMGGMTLAQFKKLIAAKE